MNKKETVKAVISTLVGLGTGIVCTNACMMTIPLGAGLLTQIFTTLGSVGISTLVSDKVIDHANEVIDNVTDNINQMKEDTEV